MPEGTLTQIWVMRPREKEITMEKTYVYRGVKYKLVNGETVLINTKAAKAQESLNGSAKKKAIN